MTKRVFVVHGWGGNPNEAWMPWLDRELTARGFAVARLVMPHPDTPTIEDWVGALSDAVGMPDAETHFVGHSIGCQTVLRYLASLPKDSHAGRVALVAGWIERGSLTGLEPDDVSIAKPWVETPIDFAHAKSVCGPILALLSDDDPVVIPDNERRFREFVGAEVHIEHGKGHYSEDSGVKEVPVVLEFLTR